MVWSSAQPCSCLFFFFNDTATTEIYTLSLHDALPICREPPGFGEHVDALVALEHADEQRTLPLRQRLSWPLRSEEHTSELQSQSNLVCRLLLEKKKNHTMLVLTHDG